MNQTCNSGTAGEYTAWEMGNMKTRKFFQETFYLIFDFCETGFFCSLGVCSVDHGAFGSTEISLPLPLPCMLELKACT